jgi:hypothetical protein
MGNLSQYADQIQGVRSRLDEADSIKEDMDDMISKRFEAVSKEMMKSLENLVNTNNKDSIMSSSVTQGVLSIAQNNQLIMRDLEKEMRAINKQMMENYNSTKSEVGKVRDHIGNISGSLSGMIDKLAKSVDKIPTRFPEQIKTDLSGLEKGLIKLELAIKEIPLPEVPKMVDVSPQINELKKMISKRTHTFEINRGANDLIKTVTVRTK